MRAELPDPHAGALANVSAELEKLGAKIEAVEKEISDTEVELRTAKEAGDTGEVGRLSKREEALRDKEKQLRDETKQLRDEKKLLLQAILAEASSTQAAAAAAAATVSTEATQGLRLQALTARLQEVQLHSPSRDDRNTFQSGLAVFVSDAPPLTLTSAVPPEVTHRLAKECKQAHAVPNGLFMESVFYSLATASVPAWLRDEKRSPSASAGAAKLYGPAASVVMPGVRLPWDCQPELFTPAVPGLPPFNGELKSVEEPFSAVVMYILFGLARAFFSDSGVHARRFYARPPVGYGIVAYPHCGYLVGVEWIGKLFVHVLSQPFFLGSDEHAAAVAALQPFDYAEYVDVGGGDAPEDEWAQHPQVGPPVVVWSTRPQQPGGFFRKIVQATAFDTLGDRHRGYMLRALHATYAAYARAIDSAPPQQQPPPALLRARLLHGAFAVMVEMPFVAGRHATMEELLQPGLVQNAVLCAIAWLARHGLLYIDLRPPNVLVDDASARCWLVDYDGARRQRPRRRARCARAPRAACCVRAADVAVLDAAPSTGRDLYALLLKKCTSAALQHVLPAMESALQQLYDEQPAGGETAPSASAGG